MMRGRFVSSLFRCDVGVGSVELLAKRVKKEKAGGKLQAKFLAARSILLLFSSSF
jgi:hypothetical protein